MKKVLVASFVAAALSLAPALDAVHAQAEAAADDDDNDNLGLIGLVGLVGLAGLAGLRRRDRYDTRRDTSAGSAIR